MALPDSRACWPVAACAAVFVFFGMMLTKVRVRHVHRIHGHAARQPRGSVVATHDRHHHVAAHWASVWTAWPVAFGPYSCS
ncbi:hypothetical protein MTO96_048594 [Rhipicephalus appendiculatus]